MGERVTKAKLVTGVIIGVLGVETPNGEFEVIDLCTSGMAPQVKEKETEKMDVDGTSSDSCDPIFHAESEFAVDANGTSSSADEWIACVSGLDVGTTSTGDAQIQMLIEYLTGEAGGTDDQIAASQISRLIIAGNSFAPPALDEPETAGKKPVCKTL